MQEEKETPQVEQPENLMKIGAVAKIFKLNTSVLRFWESEFLELCPYRTATGQRLYSQRDIAIIKKLKKLLHSDGLTIDGAKKALLRTPLPKGSVKRPIREKVQVLNLDKSAHKLAEVKVVRAITPKKLKEIEDELLKLQNTLHSVSNL